MERSVLGTSFVDLQLMEAGEEVEYSKPFALDATEVVRHVWEWPRRQQRIDVGTSEINAETFAPVSFRLEKTKWSSRAWTAATSQRSRLRQRNLQRGVGVAVP